MRGDARHCQAGLMGAGLPREGLCQPPLGLSSSPNTCSNQDPALEGTLAFQHSNHCSPVLTTPHFPPPQDVLYHCCSLASRSSRAQQAQVRCDPPGTLQPALLLSWDRSPASAAGAKSIFKFQYLGLLKLKASWKIENTEFDPGVSGIYTEILSPPALETGFPGCSEHVTVI